MFIKIKEVHIHVHEAVDDNVIAFLQTIQTQGIQIMSKLDDMSAALDAIGTDLTEIDADQQTILDELAASKDGLDAAGVIAIMAKIQSLKDLTRATADKVPTPPTT